MQYDIIVLFEASCSNRIEKVKTYICTLRASLKLKKGGKI